MSDQSHVIVNESDLEELDQLLLEASEESDCLLIDEAHGFLTANCLSSQPMEWGEVVSQIYPLQEQLDRVDGLLRLLNEEILDLLDQGQGFEPMIIEVEEEGESFEEVEGWCYGFMLAVSEAPDQWDETSKYIQELIAPIAKLALQREEEPEELTEEEYDTLVELIPGAVVALYQQYHPDI